MKVKSRSGVNELEVYGYYVSRQIRMFFVIPYVGYEGVVVVTEMEYEIINPCLDGYILRKNDVGNDLILIKEADKDDLIYGLIEHDSNAMEKFLHRLSK